MIATLMIVAIAYYWMLRETDYLRVRLLVGAEKPRYGIGRTIAQWDEHNKAHAKELEKERGEYAERQAVIKSHTCPICRKHDNALLVETKTFTYGNSTSHLTGCPDCLDKFRLEIEKSQTAKPRQPIFKPCQLPMDAFVEQVKTGSHNDWIETDDKGHGYHRLVVDYKTVFHDCLVSKSWLEAHYKDEYPEPTIEVSIDGKSISLNGNFKKGMIREFIRA